MGYVDSDKPCLTYIDLFSLAIQTILYISQEVPLAYRTT